MNVFPAAQRKVKASGAAAAVAGVILWAAQQYVFHGEVPAPVQLAVYTVVPGAVAFVTGYMTRSRPATPTPAPAPAVPPSPSPGV